MAQITDTHNLDISTGGLTTTVNKLDEVVNGAETAMIDVDGTQVRSLAGAVKQRGDTLSPVLVLDSSFSNTSSTARNEVLHIGPSTRRVYEITYLFASTLIVFPQLTVYGDRIQFTRSGLYKIEWTVRTPYISFNSNANFNTRPQLRCVKDFPTEQPFPPSGQVSALRKKYLDYQGTSSNFSNFTDTTLSFSEKFNKGSGLLFNPVIANPGGTSYTLSSNLKIYYLGEG